MTFLPIVGRELIEASRRRSTYYLRMAAAAAGLAAGGLVLLAMRTEAPSQLGLALFAWLVALVQVYCLLVGIFRTADCLSEEKRDGTLGLLFLTDLKGYDIVLGKLAATSLNAAYGAMALMPVLAIPLLAGGVAPGDFWRTVVVAVNNLFFSLAIGMFCSAVSRDERRSMGMAFSLIVLLTGGLPILGALWCDWQNSMKYYPWFLVLSPGFDAVMAFETPAQEFYREFKGVPYFEVSVALVHGLAWLLLAVSCFIVPRTWQDKPLSAAALARRERLGRVEHGSGAWRREARRRLLAVNPFLWLAGRQRMKHLAVWVFLGGVAAIWVVGWIKSRHTWMDTVTYILTMLVVHSVLKVWLVTEASRRFSADRQSGALELLLSTPLTVPEILRGQWLALEKQFAAPMFLVLVVDFIFLMAARRDTEFVVPCVAGMVMFATDMVTLSWVGMWRGLNSRRANRAAVVAMGQILLLPWLIWGVILILVAVSNTTGGMRVPAWWEGNFPVVLWVAIAIAVNLVFGLPAYRRLMNEFRTLATTRFETKRKS